MSESFIVAGRELVPITAGYEPHGYVFAVGALTYRVGPCRNGTGYTLRCVTVDGETDTDVVFATLEEAVAHANQGRDWPASPER